MSGFSRTVIRRRQLASGDGCPRPAARRLFLKLLVHNLRVRRCVTELREYADFNRDFVSWAQAQIKAGKSAAQAAKEFQVPAKYKGYAVSPNPQFGDATANTEIVYKELQK